MNFARICISLVIVLLAAMAFALEPTTAWARGTCAPVTIVGLGDSIGAILTRCNVDIQELLEVNPELGDQLWLYAGQQIRMPQRAGSGSSVEVNPPSGPAGTTVEVAITGLLPESPISISITPPEATANRSRTIESGPDGSIQAAVAIPASATAGEAWTISVQGQDSARREVVLSGIFSVTGESETYVIKRGDRLSRIASRYGTTVQEIMKRNPHISNPHRIFPGQKITIFGEPMPQSPSIEISPEIGPPGTEVQAVLTGFPPNKIILLNIGKLGGEILFLDQVQVDDDGRGALKVAIPDSAGLEERLVVAGFLRTRQAGAGIVSNEFRVAALPITYLVKAGDSLGKIAARFGVPIYALVYANPEIENPRRIYPGQELVIPDEEFISEFISGERLVDPGIEIQDGERWIAVNLTTQMVHAYEGKELVRSFLVSTGTSRYPTVTGRHRIYVKYKAADMRGPGYHLRDVPYVMYFYKGYGLHGTYWHSNFGTPMSHGCVNLRTEDAEWLFHFASIGTLVHIHH